MSAQLLGLAPELVEYIVKQIDEKEDLRNARLVCKTLDRFASKQLFREVKLSRKKRHMRSWKSIAHDENLRKIPRHVIVETRPQYPHYRDYGNREEFYIEDGADVRDEDVLATLSGSMREVSRFPNVDSLKIVFTDKCVGREVMYPDEVEESADFREQALEVIFQALWNRSSDDRTIRKLTIRNLQNCEYHSLTASPEFKSIMSGLEEFHAGILQEYNEHGPDHDYTKIDLRIFHTHFCEKWLAPISANLRALTIYQSDDNWGPFPGYFQPTGISFPKLETLVLQYYTLAHDNDLDWVLSIKSLRKLHLHKCMIASMICIEEANMPEWNVQTHDWKLIGDNSTWGDCFLYHGKWSTFFDRIYESLPDLREFLFNYGDAFKTPRKYSKSRKAEMNDLFEQRYVTFDNGTLPTHWCEAEDEGKMHQWEDDEDEKWPNLHKENLDRDQESLDRITNRRR